LTRSVHVSLPKSGHAVQMTLAMLPKQHPMLTKGRGSDDQKKISNSSSKHAVKGAPGAQACHPSHTDNHRSHRSRIFSMANRQCLLLAFAGVLVINGVSLLEIELDNRQTTSSSSIASPHRAKRLNAVMVHATRVKLLKGSRYTASLLNPFSH
jgi:hypothetical protein